MAGSAAKLPMRQIGRSLPMALLKAREATMNQFRPSLREHDLTEQQWRVIRVLAEVQQIEASELASRAVLLAPSLTRILRKLEKDGLIRRDAVRDDQRRSTIQLTPAGFRKFATVAPESEAVYSRIESRMGRAKINELMRLLAELEQQL
ncbi:MAG: homoprotocatechuate degradation operon regulator HpaR [Gammaproteobacteria bacterium]|nr:homoprotocatechuate degradation operon regulator HpaR [Gammaproteobacteria bacterium]